MYFQLESEHVKTRKPSVSYIIKQEPLQTYCANRNSGLMFYQAYEKAECRFQ